MKKSKSLGTMVYPLLELVAFNGRTGEVVWELQTNGKKLRVIMGVGCARTMVRKAQEVVGRQREHAMSQWTVYKELKKVTGYQSPDGQE